MSGVIFDHVTKTFGDVTAVDSLTLEILDGEFMVLLGPSGCGKSTALRMIAGLEEITSGLLTIGDRVVNHVPPRDRDIAMVFQSYALYPHMTVRRNIESPLVVRRSSRAPTDATGDGHRDDRTGFGVRRRSEVPTAATGAVHRDDSPDFVVRRASKVPDDERRRRVDDAAAALGLTPYLNRKPGELSGGQRQRVALARAIVRRPEVFLMDEPLSNLDAKLRTQTRLELVELHRKLGTTIVYVTHDQVEAMTMADRIAIIHEGRLQQVGQPQAVYDRPANLFVAGFVGSPPMNTLAGNLTSVAGEPIVMTGHGSIAALSAGTAAEGQAVVVGVRSEHLRIGDGPTRLDGIVENIELLGHERHVVVRVGESLLVIRQPTDAPAVAVGEPIPLVAERSGVHLFDPSTTERLN